MKYIMTIVWSLLLSTVLAYVLTSMAGEPFILAEAGILAAIITVFVVILADGVIKGKQS